ncbi:MAG: 3-oxoacyl-ACP reductase FabG [Acidobacteria bacterium]|jgi:glucose 1-dehydrogenase|nr:3-oxoacyl-ACP reductase FabG [Acidobacteriota bacterium]
MRLKDRVAIVTGASRGIGRAIAAGLAREGAAVIVNNSNPSSDGLAEEVVRTICGAGGRAAPLRADVADLAEHHRLVAAAVTQFGRLDILVNNAGVEFREPFLRTRPETWDRTLAVNLKGPYFLSQKAAEAMMGSGGGKIINISTVHDHHPLRDRSAYAISKGGLMMLTKSLAFELAEHGILVNAISPGAILTDMNREALSVPENLNRCLGKIPLKRLGAADDIVGAAVFLASSESDYVTGATLYIDGGMLLY